MILLSLSTSSNFFPFPFPLVFLPFNVAPKPLNVSNSTIESLLLLEGLSEATDDGRVELADVVELTSILSLSAIVGIGTGALGVGSTYPLGVAKST
jgi:hypothetical protein